MLKFQEDGHKYSNVDDNEDFQWVSVTTLVGQFKEKFNAIEVSERCSLKSKDPRYRGVDPQIIRDMWTREAKRATDLGSFYHNQREADMLQFKTITRDGVELPIISPIMKGKVKYAPIQQIDNGIYPEHFVYLKSASICGQADRVEVVNHRLDVYDYKTNKEIKTKGYEFWDGSKKMMLGPVKHLEDCELNHYALQLSMYMYIISKYNYSLVPGKIEIHHVEFKNEGMDKNGYPITMVDAKGEPVLKGINRIPLPYLKREVIAMLKWLKINKQMVLHEH